MNGFGRQRRRGARRLRIFRGLLALAVVVMGVAVASGQPADRLTVIAVVFAVLLMLAAWRAQVARIAPPMVARVGLDELAAIGPGGAEGDAWDALVGEALPDLERFDPADAERRPWRDLDLPQVRRRLQAQQEAWTLALQRRHDQRQRLRALGIVLALADHGVPLRLGRDSLPDLAALRAEALLLQADPGPLVLDEVPALQARRYALAIAASPLDLRDALQAHWQLLQALQPLVPGLLHLRERGWRIHRLAWNAQADLEQVDVAYALAADFRDLLRDWLLCAATVVLPDGNTLEAWVLARCPDLRGDGGDDIAQADAAGPLWPAVAQLAGTSLRALETAAEAAERGALASGQGTQSSTG